MTWDRDKVTSVDWASYPIMRHTQAPKVEIALIDQSGDDRVDGEPMACAIPAAIANAVFDATGARLRSVPFIPEKVKAALAGAQPHGVSLAAEFAARGVRELRITARRCASLRGSATRT